MAHQLRSRLRLGGLVLAVVLIASCGGQSETAATTTTAEAAPTTVAPTTPPSAETTTTEAEPPPPTSGEELVVAFVSEFAAAIDGADTEFVLARLLPEIVAAHEEGVCEDYVLSEIMPLIGLQLVTAPEGPETRTLTIGDTEITVDAYAALLSRQAEGEEVEEEVGLYTVADDGLVYWLARCA